MRALSMDTATHDQPLDLDAVRARLARMDDEALLRFGKAAAYMSSPAAYYGQPPRPEFVMQYEAAREEWQRRKANR